MKKVLLLHGWGGSDYPHWQSWLAGEIAKTYGNVSFPLLDNPHFPSKNRQMRQIKRLLLEEKPDIVICHSLACTLWFHLCQEANITPIEHLLLVAPPSIETNIDTIKTFFPVIIPTDLYAKEVMVVTSTNDPYLNIKEAHHIQKTLGVEMKIIENAGHINDESGYGNWPWVYNWVKERLK
ncbi:MAG: alpha/beta hydrolase [Epsilonproteobacteria bacterium]|nr:alpha/beta hydrolase [Campylobacterota bacterium]